MIKNLSFAFAFSPAYSIHALDGESSWLATLNYAYRTYRRNTHLTNVDDERGRASGLSTFIDTFIKRDDCHHVTSFKFSHRTLRSLPMGRTNIYTPTSCIKLRLATLRN